MSKTRLRLFALVILSLAITGSSQSLQAAPASTKTSLYITPGSSVDRGKVVNLKAWVSVDGVPVTHGTVFFCDATAPYCSDVHVLAQAQLRSSGTAEVNYIPPRGSHQIQAVYQGTKLAAASKSDVQTLEVNGSQFTSMTSFSKSGDPLGYTLTGTVTSVDGPLGGYVDFLDATNGNQPIAEAVLGPQKLQFFIFPGQQLPGNPVVAADLNGDGRLDLAGVGITNGTDGTFPIFLGNGDGTFVQKSVASAVVHDVLVGDFNNDDIPDLLLFGSFETTTVAVRLGNGDGTFQTPTPIAAPINSGIIGFVVGDFNGDGNLDVVLDTYSNGPTNTVNTFLGNGDGTFTALLSSAPGIDNDAFAAGDFNGDGNLDLLACANTCNSPFILLGNGDGTFRQGSTLGVSITNYAGVAVADFNEDGKADLVVTDEGILDHELGHIYIFNGNGDGTFTLGYTISGENFYASLLGDFNGDGHPDIFVTGLFYPGTALYLGDGNGSFSSPTETLSSGPNFIVGDFNNDGTSDLFAGTTCLSEVVATATATDVVLDSSLTGTQEVYAKYEGNKTHRTSQSGQIALWPPNETKSAVAQKPVK